MWNGWSEAGFRIHAARGGFSARREFGSKARTRRKRERFDVVFLIRLGSAPEYAATLRLLGRAACLLG